MLYGLSQLTFVTANRLEQMLRKEGSISALYNIEEKRLKNLYRFTETQIEQWKKTRKNADRLAEKYHKEQEKGIKFITILDREYPEKLKPYPGRPFGIYVRGKLPDEQRPAVAVIGARKCSNYGRELAGKFGRELAEAGVQVISGAAAGVDGISQWAALQAGGDSYGILGCGVDVIYPSENRKLYEALAESGGLISEYPPGRAPLGIQFPARNRIISGMADFLVVIEARKKSGTLITTDFALEQGKDMGAVPGRIVDALSEGCNQLIQSGALLIQNTEDILAALGNYGEKYEKKEKNPEDGLACFEKTVYSCLDLVPKHLEEVVRDTGLSLSQVMEALLELELMGMAARAGVNEYVKRLI